ncbi:MAG: hypothetical protein JST54_24235 [Deltaproteobacteria bacterium]|nr:hypothetical protein [Deltaproteobacteria bacterium]
MTETAKCPECGWSRAPASAAADKVVEVVQDLEGHLASQHDWTWQRAREHAKAWSRQIVPGLELPTAPGKAATRTAKCPQCDWTVRVHSEDLIEVSRCSSQLEGHLQSEHGLSKEAAQAAAEEWALPLLRNRIR